MVMADEVETGEMLKDGNREELDEEEEEELLLAGFGTLLRWKELAPAS
jgi:hypothetical protein